MAQIGQQLLPRLLGMTRKRSDFAHKPIHCVERPGSPPLHMTRCVIGGPVVGNEQAPFINSFKTRQRTSLTWIEQPLRRYSAPGLTALEWWRSH